MTDKQHVPEDCASEPASGHRPNAVVAAMHRNAQDNSHGNILRSCAGHALRAIEGENKAAQCLAGLHARQAGPNELALIVSMLCGDRLRGVRSVIAKAPGARHA